MQWTDVCRIPEVHTSLQQHGDDLRAVSEHTLTFYLSGTARPDPYQHAFFTGRGATPQLAEQAAYTVYLRASACTHEFTPHDPVSLKCLACGVMLRSRTNPLPPEPSKAVGWAALWKRRR